MFPVALCQRTFVSTNDRNRVTSIGIHTLDYDWKKSICYVLRSGQTMQLCSLGQGTVSPWSIVPRCPRVLQVLPTMSGSWNCESWNIWELFDTVGSTCNTMGQRGTISNVAWPIMRTLSLVPRKKAASSGPTLSLRNVEEMVKNNIR